MKATIRGTIQPPRGTPGANGAYVVDLTIEIPDGMIVEVDRAPSWASAESVDAIAAALPLVDAPPRKRSKRKRARKGTTP